MIYVVFRSYPCITTDLELKPYFHILVVHGREVLLEIGEVDGCFEDVLEGRARCSEYFGDVLKSGTLNGGMVMTRGSD
jgi:hypothetical protein